MMRLPIYRDVPTTARCGRKVSQFWSATRLDEDFKEVAIKDTPHPKDRPNGAAPAMKPYLVYYLA